MIWNGSALMPVMLLVELDRAALPPGVPPPEHWSVVHAEYASVGAPLLARLRPECIACPLVAGGFDAAQLAQRLAVLGFTGQLIVVTPALPDQRMVQAELASAAPGMRIELQTG